MQLVERHIIKSSDKQYKTLDNLCFLSKNLYNSCLFRVKQEYELSGRFLRYNELEKLFKTECQPDYMALPSNSSQQIMMLFDKTLTSYFGLLKKFKKDKKSLTGCPKFPKYKDKTKGRNIFIFTINQAKLKNNTITFPKRSHILPIKTKVDNLQQVRIIPQTSCYIIEVVYKVLEKELNINDNKASIDLGLNNLATLTFNNSIDSYIINGKPLKSINQYYNKKKSKLQSQLIKNHNKHNSKSLNILTFKRNNKITDYLHKSSKKIVNFLLENNISELAVGYNPEWKQNINIGKVNNQKFVSIPYLKFIEQLKYKCQLQGINILINEESYTSKCSAIDLEKICKHDTYLGKRIKRGMFRTAGGCLINSDINGSLNIGRKVFGDDYISNYLSNRGYGYYPIKLTA